MHVLSCLMDKKSESFIPLIKKQNHCIYNYASGVLEHKGRANLCTNEALKSVYKSISKVYKYVIIIYFN